MEAHQWIKMKNRNLTIIYLFIYLFIIPSLMADDFYVIKSAKYYNVKNKEGISFIESVSINEKEKASLLMPFIEVKVCTQKRTLANTVTAKAYFYDSAQKYLNFFSLPASAKRTGGWSYATPLFFEPNKEESLFFVFPEKLRTIRNYRVVIVFGDQRGMTALAYPYGSPRDFSFPEKQYIELFPSDKRVDAKKPFIEREMIVHSGSQSRLTLFLLLPENKQTKITGVFAACLLANNVEEIRRRIIFPQKSDELYHIIDYCKKNDLALLCWGAQTIWDKTKSWDEVNTDQYKDYDVGFDGVAKVWMSGVDQLCEQYKLPKEDGFFLWGTSKAAQYAMRLALRCPQYFHAVYVHIPSSFDKPVLSGNNILWCLTTGEREFGYERSMRFYQQCRGLNYPIIYKAIPGLGHTDHGGAKKMGFAFFDYAKMLLPLKVKRMRDIQFNKELGIWDGEFRNPPFWGDMINQSIFPAEKMHRIPASFKIPLPSLKLANEWKQLK